MCTGNICRSPIAERVVPILAAQFGHTGITASSAGIHAAIGSPIHPEAAALLSGWGADAENFAARQLNAKIASQADVILTMTREHRGAVLEIAPRKVRRTFTLLEAARLTGELRAQSIDDLAAGRSKLPPGESLDIADPIGQGPEFFTQVGEEIVGLLPPVMRLCQTPAPSRSDIAEAP